MERLLDPSMCTEVSGFLQCWQVTVSRMNLKTVSCKEESVHVHACSANAAMDCVMHVSNCCKLAGEKAFSVNSPHILITYLNLIQIHRSCHVCLVVLVNL